MITLFNCFVEGSGYIGSMWLLVDSPGLCTWLLGICAWLGTSLELDVQKSMLSSLIFKSRKKVKKKNKRIFQAFDYNLLKIKTLIHSVIFLGFKNPLKLFPKLTFPYSYKQT